MTRVLPADYLRRAIAGLPADASIILSKKSIEEWLSNTDPPEVRDHLDVRALAEMFQKSQHVIRMWLRDGRIKGYKLAGEWRATAFEAAAYRDGQLSGTANGVTTT